MKPDVVLFGEFLPEQAMAEATALCEEADLVLCVGSSLEVYPVAGLPSVALNRGARLAIVTKGPTPYDRDASVRLDGDVVDDLERGPGRALSDVVALVASQPCAARRRRTRSQIASVSATSAARSGASGPFRALVGRVARGPAALVERGRGLPPGRAPVSLSRSARSASSATRS